MGNSDLNCSHPDCPSSIIVIWKRVFGCLGCCLFHLKDASCLWNFLSFKIPLRLGLHARFDWIVIMKVKHWQLSFTKKALIDHLSPISLFPWPIPCPSSSPSPCPLSSPSSISLPLPLPSPPSSQFPSVLSQGR